jgi:hypothetical protein
MHQLSLDRIIILCYGIDVRIKIDKAEKKKSLVVYRENRVWITKP